MDNFIAPKTQAYRDMRQYLDKADETELECLLDPELTYSNKKYSQLCKNIQKMRHCNNPDPYFSEPQKKSDSIWDQAVSEACNYLKSREI
jgi:hypothetical protein